MVIDINTVFGLSPRKNADLSIGTLVKLMQDYGVEKACTLSTRGIYDDFKAGNDETLEMCKRYKQLIPVATINAAAYLGCFEEVHLRVEQGFQLFRFFPTIQEWSITGLVFERLLEHLAKYPVILMIPASEGIANIFRVTEGINNPVVITSFRYSHLGEVMEAMKRRKNIFIETHRINSPDYLEILKDEVGLEQVMYGSEAPISYLAGALYPVRKAHISEDEKAKVLGGNLKQLLKMQ